LLIEKIAGNCDDGKVEITFHPAGGAVRKNEMLQAERLSVRAGYGVYSHGIWHIGTSGIHHAFLIAGHVEKELVTSEKSVAVDHTPRVARMLALAHQFDHLIKPRRNCAPHADDTRAPVPQSWTYNISRRISKPNRLSYRCNWGKYPISEKEGQQIAMIPDWAAQRLQWQALLSVGGESSQ